jgi:hypothetical protein
LLVLTRRYFAAGGPATANYFAWWWGLTVGDSKRGIEVAGAALRRETIDDRVYWSAADATPPVKKRSRVAHLLPNYDEYFIGFKDRSAIGQRIKSAELVTGGDVLIEHIVIVDGQVVGGWRRRIGDKQAIVELKLVARLSAAEKRAIHGAAKGYGSFLGVPVRLSS